MSSPMEGYCAPTNLQLFSMCMNVSLLSHGSRKTRKSDRSSQSLYSECTSAECRIRKALPLMPDCRSPSLLESGLDRVQVMWLENSYFPPHPKNGWMIHGVPKDRELVERYREQSWLRRIIVQKVDLTDEPRSKKGEITSGPAIVGAVLSGL